MSLVCSIQNSHLPRPIFYSPSSKFTRIGERLSVSFRHCEMWEIWSVFCEYFREYAGIFVMNAPSQWEVTLHCNIVSHWLGAYTKERGLTIYWIISCSICYVYCFELQQTCYNIGNPLCKSSNCFEIFMVSAKFQNDWTSEKKSYFENEILQNLSLICLGRISVNNSPM